jgi:peptide/nickel transport system substrate-binding protein
MTSRITLRDILLFILLGAILLTLWLSLTQRDREWVRLGQLSARLEAVEQILARMDRSLETIASAATARGGIRAPLPGAGSQRAAGAGSDSSSGADRPTEEAIASAGADAPHPEWARQGVPITWQEPWGFVNDPRADPEFRPNGRITELMRDRTASLTPFVLRDFYGRWIVERVCEALARPDPVSLELRGVLADAWQLDPGGLWLRVHINPAARFSDGRPVTAEDVRWTVMELVMNPLVDAVRDRSTLNQVKDVLVIDDRTVEFVFSEALFNNAERALNLFVLPAHFYSRFTPEEINRSTGLLMGSGMFKLAGLDPERQWTPGQDVVLERNEQYWGTPTQLKSLRFRGVKDDLARLTALRRGEGDLSEPTSIQFSRIPPEEPEFAREFAAIEWVNMRSPYSFIAWQCGERNGKLTPFADKRVRQAMTMLIDRERLLRDLWGGLGGIASGPMNATSKAHNPAIKPWPYDPERAASLLAEAGWIDRDGSGIRRNTEGKPFEFELIVVAGSETDERLGNYIRDQCAKAGIRCALRPTEWSVYSDVQKRRDFDAISLAWLPSAPEPDPRQVYHSASIAAGGDNMVQWSSPEADRLIDEGRRTIDPEARRAIWRRFLEVLHEEQPYSYLREVPWFRFVNRRVGNVQPYPSGLEPWEFFVGPDQPLRP